MPPQRLEIEVSGPAPPQRSAAPSTEQIRAHLARVLRSAEFAGPARLRRFLEYVVEETLAGREGKIKAYSIAVEVLQRDEHFDPQLDPIVRIEAGRLRRALERYYLTHADEVRIDIPKGAYIPVFRFVPNGRPADRPPVLSRKRALHWPAAPWLAGLGGFLLGLLLAGLVISWILSNPSSSDQSSTSASLLVLPVQSAGTEEGALAEAFRADLLTHLSRHKEILVFAPEIGSPSGELDLPGVAQRYGARHVLRASAVVSRSAAQVSVQLIDARTGQLIWADHIATDAAAGNIFAMQAELAKGIADRLAAQYDGGSIDR